MKPENLFRRVHVAEQCVHGSGRYLVLQLGDLPLAGGIVLQMVQHDLGICQEGLGALQVLPQTLLPLHVPLTYLRTGHSTSFKLNSEQYRVYTDQFRTSFKLIPVQYRVHTDQYSTAFKLTSVHYRVHIDLSTLQSYLGTVVPDLITYGFAS